MAPIANPNDQPGEPITYDYRDSMRKLDIVTQALCLTLSSMCIGLRMYSKLFIMKTPGWEDWTCFLAWMGLVGYAVISFEADKHGSGIDQWKVAESDRREFSKIANIAQITYGPLIFLTKLSILLLYIRVFVTPLKQKTFIVIHILIWFNFFFYLADTIVKIFECTPRHKIWEKNADGYCININIPILVTSAINVASDFMILFLPIICVWRLQMMKLSKKIGISAIFAAGSLYVPAFPLFAQLVGASSMIVDLRRYSGCVASVIRLVFSARNSNTANKTHDWFPEFLWTTAEVTCGIIASCLPALPSFFRYFFQRAATRLSGFSAGGSAGGTRRRHRESASNDNDMNVDDADKPPPSREQPRSIRVTTTKDSEVLEFSAWELEETEQRTPGESQIFQGRCYTTAEAKADTNSTSVEGSPDGSVNGEKGHPPQGILKTVEVDIESTPGQAQGQVQGQGQGQTM